MDPWLFFEAKSVPRAKTFGQHCTKALIKVHTSLNYNQQDATFSQSIYFYKLLQHISGGSSAHYQEHKTVHTASGIIKPILVPAAVMDEMERSSISSMTAAVLV
jgi:hypothetical protein